MKKLALCSIALLLGCGGGSYVHSDTALGRVVVYRNGVAYFERSARVDDDHLSLSVPADKVDDFLKSLTVVDTRTGSSTPIAYPTATRSDESGRVDMRIRLSGPRPHAVRLSYVTEAPAWKPSYRVSLGKAGKVTLEGWAIVDNTSGEDWKDVRLGVASSSALSFRFDLRSVRFMQREVLRASEPFAIAPPSGGSIYADGAEAGTRTAVIGELSDEELGGSARFLSLAEQLEQSKAAGARVDVAAGTLRRQLEQARSHKDIIRVTCLNDKLTQLDSASRSLRERRAAQEAAAARGDKQTANHEHTAISVLRQRADRLSAEANQCIGQELAFTGDTVVTSVSASASDRRGAALRKRAEKPLESAGKKPPPADVTKPRDESTVRPPEPAGDLDALATRLKASKRRVLIEGYAGDRDADKSSASLGRASTVRDQLVERGVDPDRVAAIGNGQKPGRRAGVRIVEVPTEAELGVVRDAALAGRAPQGEGLEPIGSAHFESALPMTVARGSSAMVSMLKLETDGAAVYLYDRESARGNDAYAFRAVRIKNPTAEALESGPVTVFGEGRFIGEGLCEPIPARGTAFVPFALDRQIVATRAETERDEIAQILSSRRGVFTAQVRHTRRIAVKLRNRLSEPATVYVRHSVAAGYELGKAPLARERVGAAHLFRVDIPANGEHEVVIEESTPQSRSIDVHTPGGMEMVRAHLATPGADSALKVAMSELLKWTREIEDTELRVATTREQMKEYRERTEELERQVVTLRALKSAGPLLQHLEKKLRETSDRVSKATLELALLEEKRMIARIRREEALSIPVDVGRKPN